MVQHGNGWHCVLHWSQHHHAGSGNRGTDWVGGLITGIVGNLNAIIQ